MDNRSGVVNVVLAGLGGQGVLKASDIVAEAAFRSGMDVKKSELHGMSQRGGSVTSDVRFGPAVLSPMIPAGEADYLVVLEPTQVDNNRALLRPDGALIAPDAFAGKLPSAKSLNVALLGILSKRLDIPEGAWVEAIRANLPAKVLDLNLEAFAAGRAA
jgi:indolepyruvate ferredoxin oxidoreductase beta subunit